jgi:hypothetical protein
VDAVDAVVRGGRVCEFELDECLGDLGCGSAGAADELVGGLEALTRRAR